MRNVISSTSSSQLACNNPDKTRSRFIYYLEVHAIIEMNIPSHVSPGCLCRRTILLQPAPSQTEHNLISNANMGFCDPLRHQSMESRLDLPIRSSKTDIRFRQQAAERLGKRRIRPHQRNRRTNRAFSQLIVRRVYLCDRDHRRMPRGRLRRLIGDVHVLGVNTDAIGT